MKIVRTKRYLRDLKGLKASDADIAKLEAAIAGNPAAGDLIVGLSGARKIRFAMGSRGKSGGGRAVYFVMVADEVAVMLAAFAKNDRADLNPADRKVINALVQELKK